MKSYEPEQLWPKGCWSLCRLARPLALSFAVLLSAVSCEGNGPPVVVSQPEPGGVVLPDGASLVMLLSDRSSRVLFPLLCLSDVSYLRFLYLTCTTITFLI